MPDMFDHMREYKAWIAAAVTAAVVGSCCVSKGCDYVVDSIDKRCAEHKAVAPVKKPDALITQPTPTCPPCPEAKKPGVPGKRKAKKRTVVATPVQSGYVLFVKDFTESKTGITRRYTGQTPKDLYGWARFAAGGDFMEVASLGMPFVKETKGGNLESWLIAGKPIVRSQHLYHEDPCNGRQYNFILEHPKLKSDVSTDDQKLFVDHLTRYKEAVVVRKTKKGEDPKALVLFGASPTDITYEDRRVGKIIVGQCPPVYGEVDRVRGEWEGYNLDRVYIDRPVGGQGHPGAVPRGNSVQGGGGPERRR